MKKELIEEIDDTIKSVSNVVRGYRIAEEQYTDTVMALAALVGARAKLNERKPFVPADNREITSKH